MLASNLVKKCVNIHCAGIIIKKNNKWYTSLLNFIISCFRYYYFISPLCNEGSDSCSISELWLNYVTRVPIPDFFPNYEAKNAMKQQR